MSLKFTTGLVAVLALCSGPALACKGPTTIFSDNFQTLDPAWSAAVGDPTVSGGHAQLSAQSGGYLNFLAYEGAFIDTGDFCVDVVAPTLQDTTTGEGGIMFGLDSGGNFYAFVVEEDGKARITRYQNGGWLTPVSERAAPSLKTGPSVTNTLRVTWKGTSASAYINDTLFVTFAVPAFQNTMIGLYMENDTAAGGPTIVYQFANLDITNVP
jgi:hypothetical protein